MLHMTEDNTYKLPSYIFNCPMLTHLKLFNCIFKLPNLFLGLQTLTILELEKVTFVPAIEFYAINVPLLVKFSLVYCDGSQYLNIVFSSKLKSLIVDESHYNLYPSNSFFKNCKKLTYLYLVIHHPIPADKRLTLEKLLSTPTLEILSLGQLELEDNTTVDIAEEVMKYLDTPACLDRTLNKLEVVTIYFFTRSKVVLSFVKLLFAHAPSLSSMRLKLEKASSSKEELNVAKELMCLPRVSPKAKLFYQADEDLDD
uniref:FBD domain-containing protein n=1 Tax=Solanum tuberosum TaxID=4113 RepID=M0ZTC4_SOLTU